MRLIAAQAIALRERGCTRIALAQFSMARARAACEQASGLPVLTTVDSAVRALRRSTARCEPGLTAPRHNWCSLKE
jgi:aspartate/glutamate racemase